MNTSRSAVLLSGTTLAAAVMAANVVNLFFNAYLGRVVSAEDFGIITLINTFLYFGGIFYIALANTTNHHVAILESKGNHHEATHFFTRLVKYVFIVNILIAILWMGLVPLISNFFKVSQNNIFYLFTPIIFLYPLVFIGKGYLQGRLLFVFSAIIVFIEPLIKLITAYFLISLNLTQWLYISIYISVFLTALISITIAWTKKPKVDEISETFFPFKFFAAAVLTGLSSVSFLALDMILVKHYLSPSQAGEYAFLSLIGKIVYFLGSLCNVFIISLVSRNMNNSQKSSQVFYLMFFGSLILTSAALLFFGLLGNFSIPLIFSQKADSIIPYVIPYIFAISMFTLGSIIVTYHLAKKRYIFPLISIFMSLFILVGFHFYHNSLTEIVNVLVTVGIVYTFVLIALHFKPHALAMYRNWSIN